MIAAGGGGVPVYRDKNKNLNGIEAVIDKDLASALLAREIEAEAFFILTDVPNVYINFKKPGQKKLEKITVEKEVEDNLPSIVVDRRQLQEVLFNLVRNAGQAITPPGSITIRAQMHDTKVRIAIEDTGSGIPADKLQKVFDPFFTTKEPGKGTGLGLSISYGIVKDCGGTIDAFSELSKGARFVIEFPPAGAS